MQLSFICLMLSPGFVFCNFISSCPCQVTVL
jgi:hypothetical protein